MLTPSLSTGSNEIFIKKEKKGEDRERGGGQSRFFFTPSLTSPYILLKINIQIIYTYRRMFLIL